MSYVKFSKAKELGLVISPNNQLALLADKKTRMASMGEVNFTVFLDNIALKVRALVMKNLQVDCFGGTTFHVDNDIEARIKTGTICIKGKHTVSQSNPSWLSFTYAQADDPVYPCYQKERMHADSSLCEPDSCAELPKLHAISLPNMSVIYPSDFLEIPLPTEATALSYVSITPSFQAAYDNPQWQPQICEVANGTALYKNISNIPLLPKKYSHFT